MDSLFDFYVNAAALKVSRARRRLGTLWGSRLTKLGRSCIFVIPNCRGQENFIDFAVQTVRSVDALVFLRKLAALLLGHP